MPHPSAGAEREAIEPLSRCLIHRARILPTLRRNSIRAGNSEDECHLPLKLLSRASAVAHGLGQDDPDVSFRPCHAQRISAHTLRCNQYRGPSRPELTAAHRQKGRAITAPSSARAPASIIASVSFLLDPPETRHQTPNISQSPVLCVRCQFAEAPHGAPADSIFSRFDSLGIPTVRRTPRKTGSQLCGAAVAVLVGD